MGFARRDGLAGGIVGSGRLESCVVRRLGAMLCGFSVSKDDELKERMIGRV